MHAPPSASKGKADSEDRRKVFSIHPAYGLFASMPSMRQSRRQTNGGYIQETPDFCAIRTKSSKDSSWLRRSAERVERPTAKNSVSIQLRKTLYVSIQLRKTLYVSAACMRQSRLHATTRAPSRAIVTEHPGAKSPRARRRRSERF